MQFANKKVVLTGASGGIGQALAQILAQNAAQLVLVGRDEKKLQAVKASLPGGSTVYLVAADIATDEGRQRVATVCTRLGSIDVLVNCAGINDFALFEQQKAAMIAQLIDTNVTAPILLTQRLLPLLAKSGAGLIANIGSTFGSIGHPGFAAYCASKFALRGFSQALRRELEGTPVRVQYIAPRATKTTINTAAVDAMNVELGVAMDNPQQVAAQIFAVLEKGGGNDVYFGWPEKLFVFINQLLPRIVDKALHKQLATIRRFAGRQPAAVNTVPLQPPQQHQLQESVQEPVKKQRAAS